MSEPASKYTVTLEPMQEKVYNSVFNLDVV